MHRDCSLLPSSYFARNAVMGIFAQRLADSAAAARAPRRARSAAALSNVYIDPVRAEFYTSPFDRVVAQNRALREQKKAQREFDEQQAGLTSAKENARLDSERQASHEARRSKAAKADMPKPFASLFKSWSGSGSGIPHHEQRQEPSSDPWQPPPPPFPRNLSAAQASARQQPHVAPLIPPADQSPKVGEGPEAFFAFCRQQRQRRDSTRQQTRKENEAPLKHVGPLLLELETRLEATRQLPLPGRQKTFRDLQRRFHPDKNPECPDSAKLVFQKLMERQSSYLA